MERSPLAADGVMKVSVVDTLTSGLKPSKQQALSSSSSIDRPPHGTDGRTVGLLQLQNWESVSANYADGWLASEGLGTKLLPPVK